MKDEFIWFLPILVVMSGLFVPVIVMVIWRNEVIRCRSNLILWEKRNNDLCRELNRAKTQVERLRVERDTATRTIDSYYHASFHSSSEEVKDWMCEMHREYNEKLSFESLSAQKNQ